MSQALPQVPTSAGAWPRLRPDLRLYRGPLSGSGGPTWTVHDPLANRFYRLSWVEFEILSRWSLGSGTRIVQAVNAETTLSLTAEQVEAFGQFAWAHNLFEARTADDSRRLAQQRQASHAGWMKWLLQNFLFFRVPLFRPDAFLDRTLPLVAWVFDRRVLWSLAALGGLGVYLVSRQWTHFVHGFDYAYSTAGVLTVGAVLVAVKALHELGHGYAARRFGCHVPVMGVGLLVFFPVFWTDVTQAWKLADKRQRLLVDAAGILVELGIAAAATVLWALLPDGTLRSSMHLLASATWVTTLLVNLNPFMRFDGYFMLSDWMDVANLQGRAFAMGRWRLREALMGWGDPPPEALPLRQARWLVAYALATWVYRTFLIVTIALLVYHFFFKALGAALLIGQVGWFLGKPLLSEGRVWFERRGQIDWSWRRGLVGIIFLAAGIWFFVPWSGRVAAPAVLAAERETRLFAPAAAIVEQLPADSGPTFAAGEPLVVLRAPDLEYHIRRARLKIEDLRLQLATLNLDTELAALNPVKLSELESAVADLQGLEAQSASLTLRAPYDGRVKDVPTAVRQGAWVESNEPLGVFLDGRRSVLTAYVAETDLGRLDVGAEALFYTAEGLRLGPYTVTDIDRSAVKHLAHPQLASVYGGDVAVAEDGDGRLVPARSVYRVRLAGGQPLPAPWRTRGGTVHIQAQTASIAGEVWRAVLGALVRESGW